MTLEGEGYIRAEDGAGKFQDLVVIELAFTPDDEALGYLKPDDKEYIPV